LDQPDKVAEHKDLAVGTVELEQLQRLDIGPEEAVAGNHHIASAVDWDPDKELAGHAGSRPEPAVRMS